MRTRLAFAAPVETGSRRAEDALFVTGEAGFLINRASRVVSWNRAAERLTGIPSVRAIGCFWETLLAASGTADHDRSALAGWPAHDVEIEIVVPRGRIRAQLTTVAIELDGAPRILHLMRPLTHAAGYAAGRSPPIELTPRQLEILQLLARGEQARAIADTLVLSEATVRNHIRGVLREFGVSCQLAAVARARELGIV